MKWEVYRPRWQYHAPWTVTRPWLPRIGRGADEWCNESVWALGPWGWIVIFWRLGPLRTEADGPCDECLAEDERDRAAGWAVLR